MKALITIGKNTRATITGVDAETLKALDEKTSFLHQGYQFSRLYKRWKASSGAAGWDGKTHLLAPSGSFPLGLLARIEGALADAGIVVEREDHRRPLTASVKSPKSGKASLAAGKAPGSHAGSLSAVGGIPPPQKRPARLPGISGGIPDVPRNLLPGISLYDDQIEAVQRIIQEERGIVWAATGAGKTEISIAAVKWLQNHGLTGKVMFLSGRKKLLRDTRKRFEKGLAQDIGFIGDGIWEDDAQVVIASVDTCRSKRHKKRFDKLAAQCEVLFVDECHHLGSTVWYKVCQRVPARMRIGLSGTPLDRGDGKNLLVVAALGEVIYEIHAKQLADAGRLAHVTVKMIPCRLPGDMQDIEWDFAYTDGIVANMWRNDRIAKLALKAEKAGRRVLILVQQLDHGTQIANALRAEKQRVHFVHGNSDSGEVDLATELLNTGKRRILVASPIFREGVDIPEVDTVIIADGGKSVIKILQQLGRGIRKKKSGNQLTVYDMVDLTHSILADHSQRRIAVYRREGHKVEFLAG